MGGGAAHQKAILGNLVASLIAAESLVTTEAKAKALRPVAEKCVTAARKGGVHQHRRVVALIRDKDMAHKLFDEIGPRYADRARWATPGSSSWAHVRATTRRWRGSSSSRSAGISPRVPEHGRRRAAALEAPGRLRRGRLPGLRPPTRGTDGGRRPARTPSSRTARMRRTPAC